MKEEIEVEKKLRKGLEDKIEAMENERANADQSTQGFLNKILDLEQKLTRTQNKLQEKTEAYDSLNSVADALRQQA